MELDNRHRITYLRKTRDKTQHWVAAQTGINRSQISAMENGRKIVSFEEAKRFAAVFKKAPDFFFPKNRDEHLDTALHAFSLAVMQGDNKGAEKYLSCLRMDIFNLQQEFEAKLLLATYFYQTRSYDKVSELKPFLDYFFEKINIYSQTITVQKHLFLFRFFKAIHKGDYQQTREFIDQAILISEDVEENAYLKLLRSYIFIEIKEHEQAFENIREILPQLKEIGKSHLLAQAYSFLSIAYIRLKLYQNALNVLDELIGIAKENHLDLRLAMAYQQKGFIYSRQRKYAEALDYLLLALELVEKTPYAGPFLISIIKNYTLLRNFNEASKYLDLAVDITFTVDEQMTLEAYRSQLEIYQGNMVNGLRLIKKPLHYFKENGYTRSLHYIYTFLAEGYAQACEYEQSVYYFQLREELNYDEH